jgi:hypothetical protein
MTIFLPRAIQTIKNHLINGRPYKLDREQGLKPLFNESLNIAAEQAAEKAPLVILSEAKNLSVDWT